MAQPQYSDLPQGAKVIAPATAGTATYSDLPEGAKVVSPSSSSPSPIKLPDPNAPHTISDTSFGGGVETGMGLPAPIFDAAEGIGQLLRHPINSLEAIADNNFRKNFPGGAISEKDALAATKKDTAPVPTNEPDFYKYTPSPIVDAIKKGNYANAAGQIVGGVGTGLGLGRLAVGPAEPQSLARENATHVIASAVNPDAAEAPGFRANVSRQLDTIVNHGREIGADAQLRNAKTPGEALDTFANTAKSAAESDPYYVNYLKPNLDVETGVPTQVLDSQGNRSIVNNATIGQLSSRLHDINSQLSPRYQRGGAGSASANAAINAADIAPLQAEAAGIRNTIVQTLSRKMGIPAEQLEPLRANYGQLNDIADTARFYADQVIKNENTVRNTPRTAADVIPVDITNPKSTFILKKIPFGSQSPQGRALANVFQNFPASAALPPEPQRPTPPPTVQEAMAARQNASPQTPPPAHGVPDIVSQATNASRLARNGGVRVPKQLPPGPPPPAQIPTNASPTLLPPSFLEPAIRGGEPQLFGKVKLGYQGKPEGNGLFGRDMGTRTPPPSEADYIKAFGRANPFGNGRVNVVAPDGTPGHIPAEQLNEALRQGYKLERGLTE